MKLLYNNFSHFQCFLAFWEIFGVFITVAIILSSNEEENSV